LAAKTFRAIKSEIRVLGVDDGKFIPHTSGTALVVGVVFRGSCSIDGVMHTHISVDGFDATEQIAAMVNASPHSKQLRLIMLNGITFAGFNIVDIQELHSATGLPIITITEDKPDLEAIRRALDHLPRAKDRWKTVLEAGQIYSIKSKGRTIFTGLAGISLTDAAEIVELTATRSSLPEPLRVAHLIASGTS
jgi:endonuclease V-like protein UPF0215 family